MEEILKQILSELKGLKEAQDRTNERLNNIESDISEIKVDIKAIKGNEEAIKNFLLNSDNTFR